MDSAALQKLGVEALAGLVSNPRVAALSQVSETGKLTVRLRLVGNDIRDEACVYGDNAGEVVREFRKAVKRRLKEQGLLTE